MPSTAYHCDEMGALAKELEKSAVPWHFVVIPKRVSAVQTELSKYTAVFYVIDPDSDDVERVIANASAMVTLNDWVDYKPFVLAGKEAGVPSFGKVEGAQDLRCPRPRESGSSWFPDSRRSCRSDDGRRQRGRSPEPDRNRQPSRERPSQPP